MRKNMFKFNLIDTFDVHKMRCDRTILIHWYTLYYKMKYFNDVLIGAHVIDLKMMCQYTPQFSFDSKSN